LLFSYLAAFRYNLRCIAYPLVNDVFTVHGW
jgi:hypothetical protein